MLELSRPRQSELALGRSERRQEAVIAQNPTKMSGLDVAPGLGRFYRKDRLCDLCDLLRK
jgi:hypothetical protein